MAFRACPQQTTNQPPQKHHRLPTPPAIPARDSMQTHSLTNQVQRIAQQLHAPAAANSSEELAQLSKDRRPPQTDVTPYLELYHNQRPQQHPVDGSGGQCIALCVRVRHGSVCDELRATVTPISDGVRQMLFIPWRGEPKGGRLAIRLTPRRHRPTITHAHRAPIFPSAGKIMLEDLCRPTSIRHTFSDACWQIPACVVYGSATPGDVCVQSIHTVAYQATRTSKGQQGVLVIGTVKSKYQHYKIEAIEYRDMWREAFIVGRKGVVRTPEKWGWRSGHFSITLLVSGSSANSTDCLISVHTDVPALLHYAAVSARNLFHVGLLRTSSFEPRREGASFDHARFYAGQFAVTAALQPIYGMCQD